MNDNSWREGLKTGDRVVILSNHGERLDTVSRVTATQIVCGNSKYRRSNGYAYGGDTWSRLRICEPTREILDRIEERGLRERIQKIAIDSATPPAAEVWKDADRFAWYFSDTKTDSNALVALQNSCTEQRSAQS